MLVCRCPVEYMSHGSTESNLDNSITRNATIFDIGKYSITFKHTGSCFSQNESCTHSSSHGSAPALSHAMQQ